MTKKINYSPLALCLFFLVLGIILSYVKRPSLDVSGFAEKIQEHFQEMDTDASRLIQDKTILSELANRVHRGKTYREYDVFKKPYTITIFRGDSLVFWNNENIGSDIQKPDAFINRTKATADTLVKLSNGIFYIRQDSIPNLGRAIVYFPVKYVYKLQTIHLKDEFAVDRLGANHWSTDIPDTDIDVERPNVGTPILNSSGKEVFSLKAKMPVKMPWVSFLLFFLFFVSFLFGTYSLNQIARNIGQKYGAWKGVLLFGGTLILLRGAMEYFEITTIFSDISTFKDRYEMGYLASTVGGMLLSALIIVWIGIYFYKEFRLIHASRFSTQKKYLATSLLYGTIIFGIIAITLTLKGLVLNTDIPFDFDKIGDLRWSSLLSIVAILIFMLSLFLFSFRVSLTIREMKLNLVQRLSMMGLAVVVCFVTAYIIDIEATTLLSLILFSIIYIMSFDLYVESDPSNLLWIVAWLVIYSAFSSLFLYKYNQMKEQGLRIHYAGILTDDRDEKMEDELYLLEREILADGELGRLVNESLNVNKVNELLVRNHSIDLRFVHYKYNLHLFVEDKEEQLIPLESTEDYYPSLYKNLNFPHNSNIRFVRDEGALGAYFLKVKYPRPAWSGDVVLLLEFGREIGNASKVSTELFISDDFQDIEGLKDYEYAIYKEGRLVYQSKNIYPSSLENWEELPQKGKYRFEKDANYSHLIYHAWNGNMAKMRIKRLNSLNKIKSINSYLFTIMVIVLGVLMIFNALLQVLPFGNNFGFKPLPSLKNRVQVSVIAIIILSFFVIGVVTIIFFEQKNVDYHEGRLGRKAKSIRGDTAREIEEKNIDINTINRFKEIVEPVSRIHRQDVSIYDLDGRLIESSGRDIYAKGLISPLINSSAFHELSVNGKEVVTMDQEDAERIGKLFYDTQYEVLRDVKGNKIAYIGMPYYSQTSTIQDETSDFISTLLNVYVFLLVIAGAIAIFVANSITRPLSQIGEKLKEVKVGKKNEPLDWNSKDELGTLIGEYNKMIKKLEDSATLLAQSERESAWREMAKQVAHEIKNPLTPMKLSIQYLQHAYHANPNNMESMLKRVSNTLIEQIDNLSHIATEFSNFAKMPRAENERFELNALVQSVFDLFSEQEDVKMSISLPAESMMVFADKNQLMRVFNNLIKNAMQAIPETQKGEISVILRPIEKEMVRLEVKDNGSGISEDMKEFIFVPHITTKSSGTGLGLAICKSIVEALDGSIYFQSTENIGTSFFVELPIAEEEV